MPGALYLLGPQRPTPNLPRVLSTLPGDGRVLCITAGWRHEEGEDEALHHDAGSNSISVPLYEWFEQVVHEAPEFAAAYHSRQRDIRKLKSLYRIRIGTALQAVRGLKASTEEKRLVDPELVDALAFVRQLDDRLVASCNTIREAFEAEWSPHKHPSVVRRHAEILGLLNGARAIVIAGGHVGVLRNRMEFFGLGDVLRRALAGGTSVIAWSAGAMALTDRVVLFHDDGPVGLSDAEVLDRGLSLVHGLVVLPHARERLVLDDVAKVALMAERFAPRPCIGMENGAWLSIEDRRVINHGAPEAAFRLLPTGAHTPVEVSVAPGL